MHSGEEKTQRCIVVRNNPKDTEVHSSEEKPKVTKVHSGEE